MLTIFIDCNDSRCCTISEFYGEKEEDAEVRRKSQGECGVEGVVRRWCVIITI